jgi:putative chitinase
MWLDIDKIAAAFPEAKRANLEKYLPHLEATMATYEIDDDDEEIASFLAQCMHESSMFSRIEENLNYRAERLLAVFPRYFRDLEHAKLYAHNPEKLASYVYANRMGNGPASTGDGWKFRGRGLIQLTGKWNYEKCGEGIGMFLTETPDYLLTPEGAAQSAGWFWNQNKLEEPGSEGEIDEVSRIVNAGPSGSLQSVHGLKERRDLYERLLKAIAL